MKLGFQNVLELFKINFKLSIRNNLIISIIILCLIPVVHGISYLNKVYSAECLEGFVVILGIILLVPITLPEQKQEIAETVLCKPVSVWKIILLRWTMAIINLTLLILCFTIIMRFLHCKFPLYQYTSGTLISAAALGNAGLLMSELSGNIVVGYLASFGYWLLDMNTHNKYLGRFTLSSLQLGSFTEKYWLLGLIAVCLMLSVYKRASIK